MSAATQPHYLQVVHRLPDRTRLRLSPPLVSTTAEALADVLGAIPGMREVQINPRTGGILCHHDPRLDSDLILSNVSERRPELIVLRDGERPPALLPENGRSAVARSMADAFRSMNSDVLVATKGSLDLGTIAALGFMSAGAVEVAVKGNLPLPPWFNLAWWAFRTFITFETGPRAGADAPAPQQAPT